MLRYDYTLLRQRHKSVHSYVRLFGGKLNEFRVTLCIKVEENKMVIVDTREAIFCPGTFRVKWEIIQDLILSLCLRSR